MIQVGRRPSAPGTLGRDVNPFSAHPPARTAIRQLKSSLKLNHSDSASSASSAASSSFKNVRFAAEATTVKKFDCAAEPISISTESSPQLDPINSEYDEERVSDDDGDGPWFNDLTLLPGLAKNRRTICGGNKPNFVLSPFHLDYDSDSGIEEEEEEEYEEDDGEEDGGLIREWKHDRHKPKSFDKNEPRQFEVVDCQCLQSNVSPLKNADVNPFFRKREVTQLESRIFDYLQGSNIRLHSLEQVHDEFGKIAGLIYVNNLNFEKFIEIKFTFNNWKDIHFVTATYHRSVTDKLDEFKFIIDLNVLKYSLQVKDLLYCNPTLTNTACPLDIELCCRYDVSGETFYDNNNYENYQMKLVVTTQIKKDAEEEKAAIDASEAAAANKRNELNTSRGNTFARDFLFTTTLSHSHRPFTSGAMPSEVRRFSEDTDYFNTSPLRHLYHNDTSLVKPAKMNEILINSDYEKIDNDDDNDSGNGGDDDVDDEDEVIEVSSPIDPAVPLDINAPIDMPDIHSMSDSTSSYSSSVSSPSPSDGLNLLDNAGYYRYSSINPSSLLELDSDLPGDHYSPPTNVEMTLRNLTAEDTFGEIYSTITDTAGDINYSSISTAKNDFEET